MTSRRGAAGAFLLALTLPFLAQLPSAAALLSGRAVVGPDPTTVDTTTTLTLARTSAVVVADAWRASSPLDFVLRTFWESAVKAASINHIDLVLAVDPGLRSLGWPLGWTALVLGAFALNAAAGWYAAASLGAGAPGRFASALTLVASGGAAWLAQEGQLANAVLAPFAIGLAALIRLWRGDVRAAVPAVLATVLGAWLYWLNVVILAGMGLAWVGGALLARRWPDRRGVLAGLGALGLSGVMVWPGARAVMAQLNDDGGITSTGVRAGGLLQDSNAVAATIDAVPWSNLVNPLGGYLLGGGLVVVVGFGLLRRESRPLLAVVGLSAALAIGPFPAFPAALGGHDLGLSSILHPSDRSAARLALSTTPRVENPAYAAFSALGPPARMRHPVRWALPMVAALALLAAAGADDLHRRHPRIVAPLLLGSAALAGFAGPLRLEVTPIEASWAARVPCEYLAAGAAECVTPEAVPSFAPLSTRPGRQGGGRRTKLGRDAKQ